MNNTSGRFRDATARNIPTAARENRTCAVIGSPGSGGTFSSAASSGTTALTSPAPGPNARSIRSRTPARSSSGSASNSRPNARNAWTTASYS